MHLVCAHLFAEGPQRKDTLPFAVAVVKAESMRKYGWDLKTHFSYSKHGPGWETFK